MTSHKPDIDRIKAATLFVLNEIGEADYHKLFKILYFADQKHLVRFGRSITGDQYEAIQYGPVPAETYDLFKHLSNSESFVTPTQKVADLFGSFLFRRVASGYSGTVPMVASGEAPDMDELSPSDVICLSESIAENQYLGFNALTEKSHDSAWQQAYESAPQSFDATMAPVSIAQAGGASNEMIQYITENFIFGQLVAGAV